MERNVDFKDIWHSAGIGGLVLAAVSIVFMLVDSAMASQAAKWAMVVKLAAGCIKIVLCVYVMWYCLLRFKIGFPRATKADVRREGRWLAMLSALVFSAACMAYYNWHPEIVNSTMAAVRGIYNGRIDANTASMLDFMQSNFSRLVFVSQFIYCYCFGWVLSAILASRVVNSNPFNDKNDEQ